MDLKWKCRDCEESFYSKRKLSKHRKEIHPDKISTAIPSKCEYCGMEFPSKKQLSRHKCEKKPKLKPVKRGPWKCKECGAELPSEEKLRLHRKESHPLTYKSRDRSGICPRCGQSYTGNREIHLRVCPNVNHTRKQTEESKRKISIGRSKFLKEHPDQYPWRKKDKFKSIPCEHLKEILRKDGYEFQEEFHDSRWSRHFSLDIAFLDKKIAVEVNGTQHYTKKGTLSPYHQERHDYLVSHGWIVMEVFYTNVYKQEEVDKIKKAINEGKPISDEEHRTLIQILVKRKEEKELKRKQKENKKKQTGKEFLKKEQNLQLSE